MKTGPFQERFVNALSIGQTLQIQRTKAESGEGEDVYEIQVSTKSDEFGWLSEDTNLTVSDMTPGKLVQAIEDTAGVMTSAIRMMKKRSAQQVIEPPGTVAPVAPEDQGMQL